MSQAAFVASPDAFSALRRQMVDCQLRTFEVSEARVLEAVQAIPRELFVEPEHRSVAYSDATLRVQAGLAERTLLTPMVLARMLQASRITPQSRVLDVGGGTGYSAAIMALLAESVVALESDAGFTAKATANFDQIGLPNVVARTGALDIGAQGDGPFDVILVNGAVEEGLEGLFAGLAQDGCLVAIYCGRGEAGLAGKAVRFDKSATHIGLRPLFPASAPVLTPFARKPSFVF